MNNPSPTQPDALLSLIDSLAAPERLRLLHLLEQHELSVAELCDILDLPQSTVSRHLKILADQSWLTSRRVGTTHLYRTIESELPATQKKLWLLAREQTTNWATLRQDSLRLQRALRKRQSDPQSFFAGAANDWDTLRSTLYGQHFSTSALLSLIPRDYTIADLGCGTGAVALALSPHVKQILAIDNSPAMLKAAAKRTHSLSNITLRKGDLTEIPIDSSTCDAALMILSLTYTPAPARAIAEMSRILKPNGRAILVDLLPHDRPEFRRELEQLHNGFSIDQITTYFAASGLALQTATPLPPEPNTKDPALFLATAEKK